MDRWMFLVLFSSYTYKIGKLWVNVNDSKRTSMFFDLQLGPHEFYQRQEVKIDWEQFLETEYKTYFNFKNSKPL